MQRLIHRNLVRAALAAVISLGAASMPALAQADKPVADQGAAAPSAALPTEVRVIAMQLKKVEAKVLAQDKNLQMKRRQFADHVVEAMKKTGYNPNEDTQKLAALRGAIMSGKLDKQAMLNKVQEYQTVGLRLAKHEQSIMQDKALREEGMKFRQALISAIEKDPEGGKLLHRLAVISEQLKAQGGAKAQP